MIDEQVCLQNLQRIVSEVDKEQQVEDLNLLQLTYQEIADDVFWVSVMNGIKFKSILWNLDNLKPEIKSRFRKELFDKWHPIYSRLIDKDQSNKIIETGQDNAGVQTDKLDISVEIDETDVGREIDTGETDQTDIHATEMETAAEDNRSITIVFGLNSHGYKRDWFHKLLDFVAAIVGH